MEEFICKCGKSCVVSDEDKAAIDKGEERLLVCPDNECSYSTVIEYGKWVRYIPPRRSPIAGVFHPY